MLEVMKPLALSIMLALASTGCGTSPEFRQEPKDASDEQLAPLVEHVAPSGETVIGRWRGVGQQSNGSEWDMELEVGDFGSGVCGFVRYPSAGCIGLWRCEGGFDPDGFDAIEHIRQGRRCVDGVAIRLHLEDDGESVVFFAKGGGQRAAGRLRRIE